MADTEQTPERSEHMRAVAAASHQEARRKFDGLNLGAAIFGWLVATAVAVIVMSIIGAVLAAVGSSANVSQTDAQRQAATIGLVAGIVLVVVLFLASYAGGYVAGRMSRFDGARQGLGVWVIGLLVTIAAVLLGVIFGAQYNILDRVALPRMPVPPTRSPGVVPSPPRWSSSARWSPRCSAASWRTATTTGWTARRTADQRCS